MGFALLIAGILVACDSDLLRALVVLGETRSGKMTSSLVSIIF